MAREEGGVAMFMAQTYEPGYEPATMITALIVYAVLLVICAQKGKLGAGLLGVVIPFMVFGVAVRIARPNSTWAKNYYPPDGEKMRIARLRFPETTTSIASERASPSIADEIVKLAKLRNDDVITQDEFEAGKAKLLS